MFRIFKRKSDISIQLLTDEQLAAQYAHTSDVEIIGILYQRYTHLIFSVCYRYLANDAEAEDMVMVIFEKLFVSLKQSEIKNFKSWIYTFAKNECLMLLRKRSVGEKLKHEFTQHNDHEIVETDESFHLFKEDVSELRMQHLEQSLQQLKPIQRQCVELFYLKNKTYQEIEEITHLNYNEVKSHIQNGKRNLKILIEKKENHE